MSQSAPSVSYSGDEDSLSWWACTACRRCMLDDRQRCLRCGSARLTTPSPVGGRGKIYSFTVVPSGSAEDGETTIIALVQLNEGPIVTAQLKASIGRQPEIGEPVKLLKKDGGALLFGSSPSAFTPADGRAASPLRIQ